MAGNDSADTVPQKPDDPGRAGVGAATPAPSGSAETQTPRTITQSPVPPQATPKAGSGGLGVDYTPSVATQDLQFDKLILGAPRIDIAGRPVPALDGIPLIAKLGQGGMGAVYYGIHPRLEREVAVKILPFNMAEEDPKSIERFRREAKMAARIESPYLVRVLDVKEESGLFFQVMEFVNGSSALRYLRNVQQTGPRGLPEAAALDICIAATEGLTAAHAEGIVHRDIKPDNILIPKQKMSGVRGQGTDKNFGMRNADFGSKGAPPNANPQPAIHNPQSSTEELNLRAAKLADLGLARVEGLGTLTGENAVMGTPGYLAPEQARDARHAGKSADVFSMGATLYALLTGSAPFTGTSLLNVLTATINEPHAPMSGLRPEVSTATATLIDCCLAKNPTERLADGPELLEALQLCREALRANEVPRKPAPPANAAKRPKPRGPQQHPALSRPPEKKRSGKLIAAGIGAAALLLGVAIWLGMRGPAEPAHDNQPPVQQPVAQPPQVSAEHPSDLTLDLGGGVKLEMALIPAGKFMMGSPDNENGRESIEGPQHEVTISQPFYMGKYEMTQEQYQQLIGNNPSGFKGENYPVENVSWNDAQKFCRKLSANIAKTVRLPTEAEWEYACRGGTQTPFNTGISVSTEQENFGFNHAYKPGVMGTAKAGSFKPNAFGLYDMLGNVKEWCSDWYDKDYYPAAR